MIYPILSHTYIKINNYFNFYSTICNTEWICFYGYILTVTLTFFNLLTYTTDNFSHTLHLHYPIMNSSNRQTERKRKVSSSSSSEDESTPLRRCVQKNKGKVSRISILSCQAHQCTLSFFNKILISSMSIYRFTKQLIRIG